VDVDVVERGAVDVCTAGLVVLAGTIACYSRFILKRDVYSTVTTDASGFLDAREGSRCSKSFIIVRHLRAATATTADYTMYIRRPGGLQLTLPTRPCAVRCVSALHIRCAGLPSVSKLNSMERCIRYPYPGPELQLTCSTARAKLSQDDN